jgi:uncharacterized cupin superfamily protein
MAMAETQLVMGDSGLVPEGDGWFVVNVGKAQWRDSDEFGADCFFEGPNVEFEHLGINICVLHPGQPNCLYHRESLQEDFLVLAGECLLLVDGQERPLKAWDFFHCPPGVDHVFVGAGSGPSAVLMVGARREGGEIVYPVSEVAQRHGAGVEVETGMPAEAYASYPSPRFERPAGWETLPWA